MCIYCLSVYLGVLCNCRCSSSGQLISTCITFLGRQSGVFKLSYRMQMFSLHLLGCDVLFTHTIVDQDINA